MKSTPAIMVTFKDTGHQDFFGSVAAIYECYHHKELGIKLSTLWLYKLPYENDLVYIERIEIKRKPQQNRRK